MRPLRPGVRPQPRRLQRGPGLRHGLSALLPRVGGELPLHGRGPGGVLPLRLDLGQVREDELSHARLSDLFSLGVPGVRITKHQENIKTSPQGLLWGQSWTVWLRDVENLVGNGRHRGLRDSLRPGGGARRVAVHDGPGGGHHDPLLPGGGHPRPGRLPGAGLETASDRHPPSSPRYILLQREISCDYRQD